MIPVEFAALIIPTIFVSGMIWQRNNEKRWWNNGVCECGSEWNGFDMDSQGGRGYKCDRQHYVWISYNIDKK
jgi:hypothetical protein